MNDKEKKIIIFDSGVGMSKEDAVDNLGTIAKSGKVRPAQKSSCKNLKRAVVKQMQWEISLVNLV